MKIPSFAAVDPSHLDFWWEYLGGIWHTCSHEYVNALIPRTNPSVAGVIEINFKSPIDYLKSFYPIGEGPWPMLDKGLDPKRERSADLGNAILSSMGSPYRLCAMPDNISTWKPLVLRGFGNSACRTKSVRAGKDGISYLLTAHEADGLISVHLFDRKAVAQNKGRSG